MRAAIFVGPTLFGDRVLASQDFEWLPPAAKGDIYRVAKGGFGAIGLIDGQFETVPSVWHKEILWALSRGIRVFGASSMGALRAAELADFGMIGIGAIFRQFREGALQDDDEVAILHMPLEYGYRPLTDSMVDIRATLAKARRKQIISRMSATTLLQIGKALYFKERTWAAILDQARRQRLPVAQLGRFVPWLSFNRVEQKRQDAIAMLRTIRARPAARSTPFRAQFHFQRTLFWRELSKTGSSR